MLITLLFLLLIVIGVVLYIIGKNTESWEAEEQFGILSVVFGAIGVAGLLPCLFAILNAQIPANINYEKMLYEREMLVYRLENKEENLIGNEHIYTQVIEFNNELRNTKYYSNNIWTNWFYNQKIATIDYIEM